MIAQSGKGSEQRLHVRSIGTGRRLPSIHRSGDLVQVSAYRTDFRHGASQRQDQPFWWSLTVVSELLSDIANQLEPAAISAREEVVHG